MKKLNSMLLVIGISFTIPSFIVTKENDSFDQLVLNRDEALDLLSVLENILSKAPRPDMPTALDPAFPPSPFDSADLAAIARCVCLIKERLAIICSKIDVLESLIIQLESSACDLTPIIEIVESCCAQLNSKIDNLSVSACDLTTVIEVVESCCVGLNSKIDNVTNIEISILNALNTCCTQLNSKLDVITNIDVSLVNALGSCCGQLNSKIDRVTTIDNSILNALQSCCAQLNSKIDAINVSACDLTTVIEIVESCCVGLNSKIDNVTNIDISILNALQSCCAQLNSKIDHLTFSACDLIPLTSALDSCCEKIGNLSDPGSCLPSIIDVPTDINNLNLNVIELLKTILLELRGCGCNCP